MRNILKSCALLCVLCLSSLLNAQRTTYFKFYVNGAEDTVMTQGIGAMGWECDCGAGDTLMAELWLDLNKNHIIDSGDKLWFMGTFRMIDGDIIGEGGPPDSSAVPDGIFYCTLPPIFAFAPVYYVMKVTNTKDLSTATDWLRINPHPSPPVTVSGTVSIEGITPPSSLLYAIWVSTNMDEDPAFWSAITDSSGHYTLNLPSTGTWRIAPRDNIQPYIVPSETTINISGNTSGVNFKYTHPNAFVYGDIKDDRDSLILRELHIYLIQGDENVGGTVTNNGHYTIGALTGSDFRLAMWENEVFPDYLMPNFWEQKFSINPGDSLRKDIILPRPDTFIFGVITENGGFPSQVYTMEAENDSIGWIKSYSDSATGVFALPVFSGNTKQGIPYWVHLSTWETPLPEGFGFEAGNGWSAEPGDTVFVKLVSHKGSVSGTLNVDAGDPIPDFTDFTAVVVDSYWQTKGQSMVNPNGTFKVYAPKGTWNLTLWSSDMWLKKPSSIAVTVDTTDVPGKNFLLNYAHCEISGILYGGMPDSLLKNIGVDASAGTGWPDDYTAYKPVSDTLYSLNLCEGTWRLQPPHIQGYYPLPDTIFTITESDSAITINFYYVKIGAEEQKLPLITELKSIFPNPFTKGVVINYSCASPSDVSLKIYDIAGREVMVLEKGRKNVGYWTVNWDGNDKTDNKLPGGIYFCRFSATPISGEAGSVRETRKLIMMR